MFLTIALPLVTLLLATQGRPPQAIAVTTDVLTSLQSTNLCCAGVASYLSQKPNGGRVSSDTYITGITKNVVGSQA